MRPHDCNPAAETFLTMADIENLRNDRIILDEFQEAIKTSANNMQGAACPTGVDAYAWSAICVILLLENAPFVNFSCRSIGVYQRL